MPFKFEFHDGAVTEWRRTADGAVATTVEDYTPSIFVDAGADPLATLERALADDPKVASLGYEEWYTSLQSDDRSRVLRVDLQRIHEVRTLAREIRLHHERGTYAPGTFRLYNADFSPQFRYCLENEVCPTPDHDLDVLRLEIEGQRLARSDISEISIDGKLVQGDEEAVLQTIQHRLDLTDPDVLLLSNGDLVPLLFEKADAHQFEAFQLGRQPGFEQVAGRNTLESYRMVLHSEARYDVPGRVIIDAANSFMWNVSNLAGILDLVERSWKPLQEAGWGSIGDLFTAIQIRLALERGVLAPLNKWEPEDFKDVRTLHTADRDGFVFAPQVGLHEDVYEIDFVSLYPNIICQYNVSPDTVLCDCHADRKDVPKLDYNVCDKPGFLVDVLEPLLEDRTAIKQRIEEADDPDHRADLEAQSNAIKWILVCCFGYQGYRDSKFGRIECQEAINAYARDILLTFEEILEMNGWALVRGIVDSLWITPIPDREQTALGVVTDEISAAVDVRLEFEGEYDWLCFVPKRDADAGALTKCFGKVAGEDEYEVRGIEARQRSTPEYVEAVQVDLMRVLDEHREPGPVVDRLEQKLRELRGGAVDPQELVIKNRASKDLREYSQRTLTVAALERAKLHGMDRFPGQSIQFIVVDDDANQMRERVRLPFEKPTEYDVDFYATQLVRAAESIVSPLGWNRTRIRQYLRTEGDPGLGACRRGGHR